MLRSIVKFGWEFAVSEMDGSSGDSESLYARIQELEKGMFESLILLLSLVRYPSN